MDQKLIGVWWWDATQMHERIREDDFETYEGLSKNYNLGWVLHENDVRILLCFGHCSTGEYDIMVIPTNAVIERIDLCKSY